MHQRNSLVVFLPLFALIGWRIFRRVRSHIGPQPVRRQRMIMRVVWLSAVAALLLALPAVAHAPTPALNLLPAELGGLAAGAVIAAASLYYTRFEVTEAGSVYTPNLYFGIGISLLLVGRVLYRFVQLYQLQQANGAVQGPPPALSSPATMALVGIFLGYYIAYNAGVLWRSARAAS